MFTEIFQLIAAHPFIAAGCAVFGYFVVADIVDGIRKAPAMDVTHHHMRMDEHHGTNRRGE